jgi:hypothetical protein
MDIYSSFDAVAFKPLWRNILIVKILLSLFNIVSSTIEKRQVMSIDDDDNFFDAFQRIFDIDDVCIDDIDFADSGGNAALQTATKINSCHFPCSTCQEENRYKPNKRGFS